jgi:hypothetical protein
MDGARLITLSILALAASICVSERAKAQTPPDVLAAQIRAQGYHCEPPFSAERDVKQSKPDEAVWILKCRASTFRIRLDPDMAAHVDEIK